jgi:hypothetical protein
MSMLVEELAAKYFGQIIRKVTSQYEELASANFSQT